MELDTLDLQIAMPKAHDDSICGLGRDLQDIGKTRSLDDQRVIASDLDVGRQSLEDSDATMCQFARLAMDRSRCTDDSSTECFADGLMSKADSENRNLPGEAPDRWNRNARIARRTRPRRDHDSSKFTCINLFK